MNQHPEWRTFGSRVKWARQNAKPKALTQVQLAKASGLSQSTISDIERDAIASSGYTASIAAALKVSALWLESKRGLPFDARGGVPPALSQSDGDAVPARSRTPVLGEARLGADEFFVQSQYDAPDGFVKYERSGSSYALKCKGDSMRPTIKPGYFVVVEPQSAVTEGDTVMVQLMDDRRMIKILNRHNKREKTYEFTSINEDFAAITVDEADVAHVHRAVAILTAGAYEPVASEEEFASE